jgi:hypothetical protein
VVINDFRNKRFSFIVHGKQNVEDSKLVMVPQEFKRSSKVTGDPKSNGHVSSKTIRKPTTAFEFLALPQCAHYCHAFAQGMVTLNELNGQKGFLDFDWRRQQAGWDLPGSVFVEVSNCITVMNTNRRDILGWCLAGTSLSCRSFQA